MMRRHSRYDAPDKGELRKTLGQDFVASSAGEMFGKQMTPTKITNYSKRINSIMTANKPPNYNIVISSTFTFCICLFIIISTSVIQPSNQQHNAQLCPKVCTCDEQTLEVSCNGPFDALGLPHTLNPSTKRITINHAQTTQFTSSDLVFFRSLEQLDVSFNKLTAIDFDHIKSNTNLVSLNASHNNIIELKDSAVMMMVSRSSSPSLVYNLTAIIESDDYKKLRKSKINVVELDLSYNQITVIRNFTFMRLHKLQRLSLAYNSIETLEQESLFGLTKLEHLILRGNHITLIPANALHFTARSLSLTSSNEQTASPLEVIDFSENPIVTIEAFTFYSLGHVREIYLDSCLINTIDSQAFVGLSNITVISLTNGDLADVPTEALSSLTTLKTLKLNSNYIRTVKPYAFKSLSNLENLQLSNGSLLEVEEAAFYGLVSLKNLYLDHNLNLSKLDPNIFDNLPKLTYLGIQMCSLQTLIANEDIAKHPLSVVDLRGNSLLCDCNLKWLTTFLKKSNDTLVMKQQDKENPFSQDLYNLANTNDILNVSCAGPPALTGKQIINLPINKLECLRPSSRLNVHIGFGSLFFMILVLTSVCVINFCRNEKHLMSILKKNIVHGNISMIIPSYSQDTHKNVENARKETHIECSDYEPIDYGQNYGPFYTTPRDQYMDESHRTQQM